MNQDSNKHAFKTAIWCNVIGISTILMFIIAGLLGDHIRPVVFRYICSALAISLIVVSFRMTWRKYAYMGTIAILVMFTLIVRLQYLKVTINIQEIAYTVNGSVCTVTEQRLGVTKLRCEKYLTHKGYTPKVVILPTWKYQLYLEKETEEDEKIKNERDVNIPVILK